jgi:hypothetical protein
MKVLSFFRSRFSFDAPRIKAGTPRSRFERQSQAYAEFSGQRYPNPSDLLPDSLAAQIFVHIGSEFALRFG